MAATTTLKTLIESLLEETGLGCVLPTVTGTTTQLTLANAYAAGPFLAQRFTRGSAILTTAGTAINENTFVDTYTASTGVITTTPSVSGTYTDAVLAYFPHIDHMDRVKEAINRALTRRTARKQKVPLTFVEDGEMLGTVSSYWRVSLTVTVTYASVTGSSVAASQVLQLTHTSATEAESNPIEVRASDVWEFDTAIRAVTTSGMTAAMVIWDETNGAAITPTYELGTGSTTSNAFVVQRGTFTIPSTCDEIVFRLTNSASGTVQMAPVIAAPINARSFPLTNRVLPENVGNFYRAAYAGEPTGPETRAYSELVGYDPQLSNNGDHLVVSFATAPGRAYYDEFVYGTALSAMTDTTTFPDKYVLTWAKYELRKMLYEKEQDPEKRRMAKVLAMEAKKSADRYEFNSTDIVVVAGRR